MDKRQSNNVKLRGYEFEKKVPWEEIIMGDITALLTITTESGEQYVAEIDAMSINIETVSDEADQSISSKEHHFETGELNRVDADE